jgi:hypothetical protein
MQSTTLNFHSEATTFCSLFELFVAEMSQLLSRITGDDFQYPDVRCRVDTELS